MTRDGVERRSIPPGRRLPLTLASVWLCTFPAAAAPSGLQECQPAVDSADTALARYIATPDPAFAWTEVSSGHVGRTQYRELILTSQTWRDIPWKHQLVVFLPRDVERESGQGFLFVHGGRWRAEFEHGWKGPLPSSTRLFARLAETLRAPVGVLRHVPHQPLFGRTEDRLIAYTFDRYLATGDESWPLLLPMVKSAVRAMDAMQQMVGIRWGVRLERFTVAGASKRGWTTWLTAAVDQRVNAIAPMVIDMLDIPAQIDLQKATFGELSEQVRDYEAIGLPDRVGTPRGQRLMEMVDPYRFRDRLLQAKLIVLGTNDRYWPLDALNLYWQGLEGPKHIFYAPNQGHSVRDYRQLIYNLAALHRHATRGATLPAMDWNFASAASETSVALRADPPPHSVRLWLANSESRDFREASWTSRSCRRRGEAWICRAAAAGNGLTAYFAEATWRERGAPPYSLSTTVCIRDWRTAGPGGCLMPAGRSDPGSAPIAAD
jgi:PhoPQ-activated pathogenicity-related protein